MEQQIVALAEDLRSGMQVLGGSNKNSDVMGRIERDIGGVASAPARLLNDHGWVIRLINMHPPEADAVGNTGSADALRPAEFRSRDVRSRCGRVLVHGDSGQTEKIF